MFKYSLKYTPFIIISILSLLGLHQLLTDDAYIFYTYAVNTASGKGWVFNTGENVNALTSTLYPLLLMAGGKLGLDIQKTGIGLSILFLGISGLLLAIVLELITGKGKKASAIGIFTGILFYLWHPIIPLTFGMETALNSTLILASLLLYYRGKTLWAAITLGLLTLTRYDGVLLAIIIGGDYLLQKKKLPWKEGLIYIAIMSPWLIYSQLHFHTILPSTLEAKMDFGLQLNQHTNWGNRFLHAFLMALPMNILGTGQNTLLSQVYLLLIIVFGLMAFIVARKNTLYRIITIWGFCYAGAYAYLNVPFVFVWYWVPLILVFATWIGISIQYLYDQYWVLSKVDKLDYRQIIYSSFYGFIPFLLFIHFGTHIKAETAIFQYTYQKELAYSQVSDWINKNTPPNASILMEEIGFVGYYTHRRIIDQSGLATPEVIKQYQKGNLYWAYEHYQPDILIIHKDKPEDACNLIFRNPALLSRYTQVTSFPWPENKQILIYKRITK